MVQEQNGLGEEELKKKRGAPLGNQNARTHGFYSTKLDESQQLELEQATGVEGIDAEIALLRVKIKSLIERDPDNTRLILQAVNTLAKMLRTKYNIGKEDKQGWMEAIGNVLKDIAFPLGFNKNQVTIGFKK
ncbi:MAG: hypothetical protein A2Z28_03755 [Chloroflexi bacterium RBG_16_51_9]|nr:MAG: hypothetical protein A2Z28_03755 [Chloroflexi bacterium RBG_16_51_9]